MIIMIDTNREIFDIKSYLARNNMDVYLDPFYIARYSIKSCILEYMISNGANSPLLLEAQNSTELALYALGGMSHSDRMDEILFNIHFIIDTSIYDKIERAIPTARWAKCSNCKIKVYSNGVTAIRF